jgi:callose synthase
MAVPVPDPVFNILPVDFPEVDHAGMLFPEVKAALTALQKVWKLPLLPVSADYRTVTPESDMLDWLGGFFGFQADNVRNQREHLVLLLANGLMTSFPIEMTFNTLEANVVSMIRKKVTGNYVKWCKFIGRKNNMKLMKRRRGRRGRREQDENQEEEMGRELMYISLFLLIWGEAANLRFMPECLCFIYHHMLVDLNTVLDSNIEVQGELPSYAAKNGFLNHIVVPIYEVVKAEADSNNGGSAPHSSWRNYDDMNEYFWTSRCFDQLQWPIRRDCSYLQEPKRERGYLNRGRKVQHHKVGKTGFVEQRSFWYIFRSFDRIWLAHILFLQASVTILWHNGGLPWNELQKPDPLARFLSIFITWSLLRVLQGT